MRIRVFGVFMKKEEGRAKHAPLRGDGCVGGTQPLYEQLALTRCVSGPVTPSVRWPTPLLRQVGHRLFSSYCMNPSSGISMTDEVKVLTPSILPMAVGSRV